PSPPPQKLGCLFSIESILAGLILTACAPQTIVQTQIVTQPAQVVVETKEVPVTQIVSPTDAPQTDRVQIYWYIGLGAGSQPAQIEPEKAFVDKFNKSQTEIQLIPIIVDNKYASDNLTAQIAAGNAPDIVGPVGTEGRASFPGQWLDLEPLVAQFNYDTSDIDPAFLDFYKVEGKLEGLPFAIYPSVLYFNRALFDEAGLAYPPQKVGDKYTLDGKEVEWNMDTLAQVAERLTVDAKGNDATQTGFDPKSIAQYGFDFQWVRDNPRWYTAYFQPYYPVKDGQADISAGMRAGMQWYYDGIFGPQPFAPDQAAIDSDLLGKGNTFGSGHVAMALTHSWYTCCIDPKVITSWDIGVVPSYDGKTTAKMHGDTFAIMTASKHPAEAFKVYTYMLGEGSAELYPIYGGLPARKSQQTAFFDTLSATFAPNKVDWQVALDMIPLLDVPNHQLGLPNNAKSNDAWLKLGSDLRTTPGLDVNKRIDEFISDWNTVLAEPDAGN
ncbi:MAG: extracellular solute-binding protein, partial [Anaerolineales bacterium]